MDAFMAYFENYRRALLIFGTEEDVQKMDCETNLIFAITTNI